MLDFSAHNEILFAFFSFPLISFHLPLCLQIPLHFWNKIHQRIKTCCTCQTRNMSAVHDIFFSTFKYVELSRTTASDITHLVSDQIRLPSLSSSLLPSLCHAILSCSISYLGLCMDLVYSIVFDLIRYLECGVTHTDIHTS